MLIRKTIEADIPQMLAVYDAARRYMRSSGNLSQWSNSYPSEETIRMDMNRGGSYVCIDANGCVSGTFFFLVENDPTYNVIYDGKWLNDKTYGVIHRIASDGRITHLLRHVLDFCFTQTDTIRIDTHRDNHTMIDGLTAYGFTYCGIIHLANGDDRVAFQKSQI